MHSRVRRVSAIVVANEIDHSRIARYDSDFSVVIDMHR